jgi:N4-gp56 family major capsid protein
MYAWAPLRAELYFDMFATVKPTRQDKPGSSVIFTQMTDMAVVSTAISESTDVDAVALSDANVTVTLAEYGNVAKTTAKLRGTSYIPLNPWVTNVIAFNAGISVDTISRDVLKGGTNVRYVGGASARNTVTPALSMGTNGAAGGGDDGADLVRRAVAELRGANVPTFNGAYAGVIHPDASYDFRGSTGGANWRDPHIYSSPEGIWNGEIGQFEGVRFVEASRAPIFADAGSSTTLTDVYATLIFGRDAFAKAWSIADGNGPTPRVFPTPIVDNLRRFQGMAWYWLGGYGIFRQAALRRIESASTIGSN